MTPRDAIHGKSTSVVVSEVTVAFFGVRNTMLLAVVGVSSEPQATDTV